MQSEEANYQCVDNGFFFCSTFKCALLPRKCLHARKFDESFTILWAPASNYRKSCRAATTRAQLIRRLTCSPRFFFFCVALLLIYRCNFLSFTRRSLYLFAKLCLACHKMCSFSLIGFSILHAPWIWNLSGKCFCLKCNTLFDYKISKLISLLYFILSYILT